MITVRESNARGHANHGWLDSYHSFSFADYYDPEQMGFRDLRVINEDRVAGGGGFPLHPHRDMEIITWVLSGALEHKDSLGNAGQIHPGELQRMSAGAGIRHSEFNASAVDPVHLLQIWILPERKLLPPSYEQKSFADALAREKLVLLAAPDGRDGAVTIHQDVEVLAGQLKPGEQVTRALQPGRHAWVQVAEGVIRLNEHELRAGDGAAVSAESSLAFTGVKASQFILFDLN